MRVKIHKEKFRDVLDKELYTVSALARDIGTSQSYLSRIQSERMEYAMSKTMARKILEILQYRYNFEDIFFVVE